jgi:hypothetical protein
MSSRHRQWRLRGLRRGCHDDFGVERPELIGDVRVERDGGDSDQWTPALHENNRPIEPYILAVRIIFSTMTWRTHQPAFGQNAFLVKPLCQFAIAGPKSAEA